MPDDYPLFDPHSQHQTLPGACALTVMAKAPRVGAVKTRLVPPLMPGEAAALNACFLRDLTANIAEVGKQKAIHGFAAYTPQGEESAFAGILSPGFRLLPQRGANLGDRLYHAFEDLFCAGYKRACLINSDSPTLPTRILQEAVEALETPGDRVVLGEAADGGYYLIGLKRAHPHLFHSISWSTEQVLLQTLERASGIGLQTKLLPVWYDVDDVDSLRRLCKELFASNGRGKDERAQGYRARYTAQYLGKLLEDGASPRLGLKISQTRQAL